MMKRHAILAALAATAVTATALVIVSPVSGVEIECRYAVPANPVGSTPNPPTPPLIPNHPISLGGAGIEPYRVPFVLQNTGWSVVGVRAAGGTHYDLDARDCRDGSLLGTSAVGSSSVEFVALDGTQGWPDAEVPLYSSVWRTSRATGSFTLEYSADGPALTTGTPQRLIMDQTPALVRDVYVASGRSATIQLLVGGGDGDLAVMASTGSRGQAIALSAAPGLSPETVTISVPAGVPGRKFGVVVVNNAIHGEYTLLRV